MKFRVLNLVPLQCHDHAPRKYSHSSRDFCCESETECDLTSRDKNINRLEMPCSQDWLFQKTNTLLTSFKSTANCIMTSSTSLDVSLHSFNYICCIHWEAQFLVLRLNSRVPASSSVVSLGLQLSRKLWFRPILWVRAEREPLHFGLPPCVKPGSSLFCFSRPG